MKHLILITLFSIFSLQLAQSQLLPILNQYREHIGFVNPAAVSTDFMLALPSADYMIKVGGGHRIQWVDNDTWQVNTSIIDLEAATALNGIGLAGGLYFVNDEVDVTETNSFFGRGAVYVGDLNLGRFWGGVGFNVGYTLHSIDLRRLRAYEGNDPLLEFDKLTGNTTDLGVGVFGVYQLDSYNKFVSFGLSMPQLLEQQVTFDNSDSQDYDYTQFRHVYGHASFVATTSSSDRLSFFEATAWVKHVQGFRPNIDVNLRYQISSAFSFGLGGNSNSTLHLEAGTNLFVDDRGYNERARNRIRLTYGLDFPFNTSYSAYSGPSHEIHVFFLTF